MSDAPLDDLFAGYIGEPELCKQLGVTRRTLARWAELGIGPTRTALGRKILYSKENVRTWLIEREKTKTRPRARRLKPTAKHSRSREAGHAAD